VGDRWYGVGACCAALRERGLGGLWRRNGPQSWRGRRALSQTSLAGGTAGDTLLEIQGNKASPTQTLRWRRGRQGREQWERWPNVLEPKRVSLREALRWSPWRWQGERLFFDLTEVVHVHRFSTGRPHGVARQV